MKSRSIGIIALLCVVGAGQAADLPSGFPKITVTTCDNPAPGYIFVSNFTFDPKLGNVPFLMILDNTGYPVTYKELTSPLNLDFKLLSSGKLVYCDALEFKVLGDDLEVIASFDAGNGYHTDPHEYRLLPNGHAYILAWTTRVVDMADQGGLPNARVQDMAIQEIDDAGNVYWQWETADHLEITDTTPDIPLTAALIDYAHCNAIEVCPDGNLLLSVRHFDEIMKIDRQTGAILWRMGGSYCKNNQFTFSNDDFPGSEVHDYTTYDPEQTRNEAADPSEPKPFFGFSHQHGVRLLENGHIALFDNGNLRDPHFSRAVEYEVDEANRTVRKIWEYRNSPDVASDEMGNAWRLDNGNTLIGWGGNDQIVSVTEVHPNKTKAFELHLPDQVFSYRAYRFVYGMSALTQQVDQAGEYSFTTASQPTGVALQVETVTGAGDVVVERHNYRPPRIRFFGSRPLGKIPGKRWVIRWSHSLELSATVRFEGPALGGLEDPGMATVWYREAEGNGDFTPLSTRYESGVPALEADLVGPGELILVDGNRGPLLRVHLEQNAPNPFHATTAIRYALPVESSVRLTLYSTSGRELIRLVDAVEPAGDHEVVFNAGGFASGTYFYRLQTPAGTLERKTSLIHR